ncbi:hypothetical protein MMC08_001258 [Hypocenomyce scalaris]|nr:hypothetical protein [Hypocenomyce scalaris]
MTTEPIVSHGRGGAANIRPDPTPYADGEIVREGPVGDQGDGAFSTGRGGTANIGSPHVKPTLKAPGDEDIVPETAIKPGEAYENYHTGRGGEGNIHKEHRSDDVGLADKLKAKMGMGKKG